MHPLWFDKLTTNGITRQHERMLVL